MKIMINPIYFFFYLFYRILKPISKHKDRIPFTIIGSMALILLIHIFILINKIRNIYNVDIIPDMNKYFFAIIIAIPYFVICYFLFERNNRYIILMDQIKKVKKYKKTTSFIFLMIYFFSPLIIMRINFMTSN